MSELEKNGEYFEWIGALKTRYRATQIKAAVSVNAALLEFYWELGRDIAKRYPGRKRNARFFSQLSADLKVAMPDASGFSVRNLQNMLRFYELYLPRSYAKQVVSHKAGESTDGKSPDGGKDLVPSEDSSDNAVLPRIVAKLLVRVPWGHHVVIMNKCKGDVAKALFYVRKTVENGWSRNVLGIEIDGDLYGRAGKAGEREMTGWKEMLWIEGMEGRLEMRRMKKLMVAGAMVLALAVAAWGEDVGGIVPGTMNFQARLARVSEGAATPLTGIQHVAFRLYDAAEGGTLVWAREFPVTCTSDGTFNLVLDDGGSKLGTPAEEKLGDSFQGTVRYFELEVEGIGTLQPRMRVPTAPYAFQAQYTLRGGDGGFEVGGTLSVADDADLRGAVTAGTGKVDSLTVTSGGATAGSMSVTGKVTVPAGKPNEAKGVVPVGGILAWTRADIPTGWAICDGNIVEGVQTPDLRGLFVMGAGDGHDVNSTGGAASVKLTTNQIPSHTHGYVYPSGDGQGTWFLVQNHDGHIWRHYTDATTGEAGGDEPHENRPPFFAVYYIMRVK